MQSQGTHQTHQSSCSTISHSRFIVSDCMRKTHGGALPDLAFRTACVGNSIRLPRRQGASIPSRDLTTSPLHGLRLRAQQCTAQVMETLPLASGWRIRRNNILAEKPWLRGGFGVFYDLGTGVIGDAAQSYPHRRQKTVTGLPFPLGNAASPPPVPSLQPPYSGQSFLVFDPDMVLPRTYQWNLGVQQSLGSMQMVSASYVGAVGRDLLRRESVTGSGPNFIGSSIDLTTNTATSDYHALQLQFQRRLSRGLQAQASYSWAHSIDIASNDFDDQIPSRYVLPALNRGSSDFDVRHSFSTALTYEVPRLHQGVMAPFFMTGLLTVSLRPEQQRLWTLR